MRHSRIILAGSMLMVSTVGVDGASEDIDSDHVVAIVEGVPIPYKEISVAHDDALARYRLLHGCEPTTREENALVYKIKCEREVASLKERVRAIALRRAAERLGVQVSEQEVRQKWAQLVDGVDLDKVRAVQHESLGGLLSALKAVHEDGEDKDKIYRERLQERMSRQEWDIHVHYYRTPGRRKLLEDALVQTGEEWELVAPGIRAMLLQEKMDRAIDQELAQSDAEYAEYLRLMGSDPTNDKVQSKGPMYKDAKRYEWWQQRYRETKVEIKHERFKDAWKEPFQ